MSLRHVMAWLGGCALLLSTSLLCDSCASRHGGATRVVSPADPRARELEILIVRDYAPDDTGLAPGRNLAYAAERRFADVLENKLKELGYTTTENILRGGDVEVTLDVLMPGPNTLEPRAATLFARVWVQGRRVASVALPYQPRKELTRADLDYTLELVTRPALLARAAQTRQDAISERERADATARQQAQALMDAQAQAQRQAETNAREQAAAREQASHSEVLARQQTEAKATAERSAWASANASSCLSAQQDDSCEGVAKYLKRYPNGTHANEARQVQSKGRSNMTERSYFTEAVTSIERDPDARDLIVKSGLCNWPCGTYRDQLLGLSQDLASECGGKCSCCDFCQGQCGLAATQQDDGRVSCLY